jgi:flagellar biosynthesis protein FlhG
VDGFGVNSPCLRQWQNGNGDCDLADFKRPWIHRFLNERAFDTFAAAFDASDNCRQSLKSTLINEVTPKSVFLNGTETNVVTDRIGVATNSKTAATFDRAVREDPETRLDKSNDTKPLFEPEQTDSAGGPMHAPQIAEPKTKLDQAQSLREMMANKTFERVQSRTRARFIVVASGKGGVGKSTVALNLGIALSRRGKRIVLVDGDLGLANLDTMLGVRPSKTLWHYINAGAELDEIVIRNVFGIDLLPGGTGLEDLANLSPAQTDRLIRALEDLESQSDFIIIDTGAGINHRVIAFSSAADRVILVAAPESTAILDAYGLVKVTCSHHARQRFDVVLCRVAEAGEARRLFNALNTVVQKYTDAQMELIGFIPNDDSVKASINQHKPLLALYPRSSASQAFVRLAQVLALDFQKRAEQAASHIDVQPERLGFIRRFFGALKSKA